MLLARGPSVSQSWNVSCPHKYTLLTLLLPKVNLTESIFLVCPWWRCDHSTKNSQQVHFTWTFYIIIIIIIIIIIFFFWSYQ